MKVLAIVFSIVALLLLISMLICGLWSKSKGFSEDSAKEFHMQLGVTSMFFGIAAIILLLIQI